MAKSLDVYMYGARIGAVTQNDYGRRSFTYDSDYASDASRPPLSLSMPVSGVTFSAKKIDPFMWGLLPDNADVRARWANEFGVSVDNPFAILTYMGRDCAGGAKFVPTDAGPRPDGVTPLSERDIGDRLRRLRSEESAWVVLGERWSLAGAQAKFTITQLADGSWCEARGDVPSTHIVKPGISDYRQQGLVEHVSMRAAAEVGLRVARTEYREFDGEPALVVTRFDRRRARDGSVVRVHQEDMCQSLAIYPRRKYEASGGPGAAAIAKLLLQNSTNGESDVWEFAQALVFNYLIGAPDAHAKNYSLAHAPRTTRITPLYDVASALPYEGKGASEIDLAAMSIGGRRKFGTVHGRHWDRLAAQIKVDPARLREEIVRQASAIPLAFLHNLDAFDAEQLRDRLLPPLSHLCASTITQLDD